MSLHVIVGAGPVGATTARLLADRGEQVRIVTRRGTGPDHAAIEKVAADASDPSTLTKLASGATVLYNCAGAPYHQWPTYLPPLAEACLTAAHATDAVLVTTSNLYGYGPVDGPMTEQTPQRPKGVKGRLRARLWREALAAHEAGEVRATEVRGSDYLGADTQSLLSMLVLPKVLAGARVSVPADLDAPHSWTYTADVARTLVAAGADGRAWGRPWHVPSAAPVSMRELAARACALAGAPAPRLSTMPKAVLWLGGLRDPLVRELRETQYQFRRPFVLDSSATTTTFGIEANPLEESLREMVA
ncbi:NAD-dependent epimerase/dehydratase family protein [Streptomyces sp. uw30]|uniref:NAD-dependent epimerase/dehydratase family protein n=1 Tax=Streptomyces sp. uw30 TaxID=1828179 RepID=UPI0011CDBD02|nr:NAD-dependent epimerase/dehydratase family protein [Streptomyces sp. uw30]TXS51750.1 NAD-dependent epimerase/dehydratase family protein [Streptomyces sp. uw30]